VVAVVLEESDTTELLLLKLHNTYLHVATSIIMFVDAFFSSVLDFKIIEEGY
jgi:hypothetical protein